MTAEEAYALAASVERARAPLGVPGYRLYWMMGQGFGSREVQAESSVVVGRHTQCDAMLDRDETVALRHLLVRASCLDDGCPLLSVVDLRTHDGFELSDGTRQRSIVATGPVVLRVGAYSLVALPSGGKPPEALPAPMCERGEGHPYRVMARRIDSEPRRADSWSVSRVTMMPRALELAERPSPSREASAYELILESNRGRAGVLLSPGDVDQGVLIGRAEKCLDAGLRSVLNIAISRVHLLILRGAQGSVAYDVASTQGTYHQGRAIRSLPLDDGATSFSIGSTDVVQLRWRGV